MVVIPHEDEEAADTCAQDKTEDYLVHEINYKVEFSLLNRTACFMHMLQLVVHKFNVEVPSAESDSSSKL